MFACASGDAPAVFGAVTIAPEADSYADLTVNVTVEDGGQFGSGGAMQATDTIALEVVGVNDAPVLVVDVRSVSLTIAEDGETAVGAVAVEAGAGDGADGVAAAALTLAVTASDGAVVVLAPGLATGATGVMGEPAAGGRAAERVCAGERGNHITTVAGASGTGSVTLGVESGLIAAAVSMVQVVPAGDYSGDVTVTLVLDDGGSVGISDAEEPQQRGRGGAVGDPDGCGDGDCGERRARGDGGDAGPCGSMGSTVACVEDGRSVIGAIGVTVSDAADDMAGTAVLVVTATVEEAGGVAGAEGALFVGDAGVPAAWSSAGHAGYDLVVGLNNGANAACGTGAAMATAAGGCVVVSGDGTRSVTLEGQAGPLSTVLGALVFAATADFYGVSTVRVSVSDLGNAGSGNVLDDGGDADGDGGGGERRADGVDCGGGRRGRVAGGGGRRDGGRGAVGGVRGRGGRAARGRADVHGCGERGRGGGGAGGGHGRGERVRSCWWRAGT